MSSRARATAPVNALDQALRSAIVQAFPEIAKFELIDFKVRILDQGHGTDAITRVLIETSDGGESSWVTVGVGANMIEASWEALVDGLTYGLLRHHVLNRQPSSRTTRRIRSDQPAKTCSSLIPPCSICWRSTGRLSGAISASRGSAGCP